MAYVLDKNINMKGRDNSPGGSIVYLAEWSNIDSISLDASGTYVTGITMSGSTYFYKYEMPRENINFTNQTEISIPNGVFIFKPLLNFSLPGLSGSTLNMFDVLVRKSVVAIVKTNEQKYFIIGKDNGLDLTSNGNFVLGQAGTDLVGAVIELEGLENSRIFQLEPSGAAALMATIVSTT